MIWSMFSLCETLSKTASVEPLIWLLTETLFSSCRFLHMNFSRSFHPKGCVWVYTKYEYIIICIQIIFSIQELKHPVNVYYFPGHITYEELSATTVGLYRNFSCAVFFTVNFLASLGSVCFLRSHLHNPSLSPFLGSNSIGQRWMSGFLVVPNDKTQTIC